ncbi:hypothetical protein Pryu01_00457 [Paraliobacillus ryukyuensis]|uniref:Uncharacterized protein DUF3886 n=1 Tax=Paraliobacillus ryukyuensis TaxID=200904 RepID=A0A366EGB1_9BACI|nr:YqkE family protein [Paraliobacillus ryukyuensis]RBP01471.1 uncharacterized protein DUF3886 [Paraliobacillus ryukyuensis]
MSKAKDKKPINSNLNQDVLEALQKKKQHLKEEVRKEEEVRKKQRVEERKRREANKSFAELFEESELDWKKFK